MSNNEDFYQKFREDIHKWIKSDDGKVHKFADLILLGPDLFHLLTKLSMDKDVPVSHKVKLGTAIAYFISPVDLIPEALLGPVGYIDDIAVAAYVLNNLINDTDPELVRKHWAGDEDILKLIQRILDAANSMVGAGLWKAIKGRFSK